MVDAHRKLAIIGGGSSGLITLKLALELLPEWRVTCFEASESLAGAWGRPYDGFVSTSTKYTTQFASFPQYDTSVRDDRGASRQEFFRDGEYGDYLNRFADHFGLRACIAFGHRVDAVRRLPARSGWEVRYQSERSEAAITDRFDAVVVCTGLVAEPKSLGQHPKAIDLRRLMSPTDAAQVSNQTVVVVGGGEMATDFANRFAQPHLNNRVYLSLRSGIRVSPRYHPIRGVPSDFLRNRLMLSIHEDLRNAIGARFVAARIRYQDWFERLFPDNDEAGESTPQDIHAARKAWGEKLNRRAPDGLFDRFHNKSDDFLSALAEGRLRLVGPATDATLGAFHTFDGDAQLAVNPDVIVPAVGFRSRLSELLGEETDLTDFYHGCLHTRHDHLFLVGFARPVIGNIPSISEMQARYVIETIAGRSRRPKDLIRRHRADIAARRERFRGVDTRRIYPVEMFPYCDRLAREMGVAPQAGSVAGWWRIYSAPATTLDYTCFAKSRDELSRPRRHLPLALIALLLLLKPIDWAYRLVRRGCHVGRRVIE